MSKYVPDVLSSRWVIISPHRTARPDNFEKKEDICPFCPGNEKMSPDEVMRYGEGEKNEPGWQVRTISNKYPITDFHEVIIHSPDCKADFENLPISHVEQILKMYRDRYNFYRKKGQVLIFCNHGEHAGASLKHPHSQLVVIPFQIKIDTLSREPLNNIVDENHFFHVYCPDFSQWPYEVWMAPKKEGTVFGDINDEEILDIAELIQKTVKKLESIYNKRPFSMLPFGYNFYIHPKENWYLRIMPRFVHRAGFELGTGLMVNITDPATAAMELQGVDEKMADVITKLDDYKK